MSDLDQFQQTYFQECEELLGDLESQLLILQEDGSDVEAMHAVFRAIHSIKGGAGAFGFERLVSFSHAFETILDLMREGQLETSSDNVELSVHAADIVADLVQAARSGEELEPDYETEMLASLHALIGEDDAHPPSGNTDDDDAFDAELGFVPVMVDGSDPVQEDAISAFDPDAVQMPVNTFSISFTPHTEMLKRANEPLLLIRELKSLGGVTATPDLSSLPSLENMVPQEAYLRWELQLITTHERDSVQEVFEFVDSDCDLNIELVHRNEPDEQSAAQIVEADAKDDAKNGIKNGIKNDTEQAAGESGDGETSGAAAQKKTSAAKSEAPKPAGNKATPSTVSSVRVDLAKMDRLVNMVGELVITQAMLSQQFSSLPQEKYPNLMRGLDELAQHTRGLQDSVMAMRAQPVKSVFSRIPRLVRELSAQTDKKIKLVMSGEGTEIDKTVIEQLGDPLTHMIRNACDHGIESPEQREAAGKPAEGTIHLSAEHRGGRILIEIKDDGKGISRERVLQKAVEKGLVPQGAQISDEQIDNLIFHPGFSTAETVSNISGRGVGMDVVIRNIQNMGGRVMVRSNPGKGSSFSLTLPLTLAVLDGMIVRVGGQSYVIPLTNIIESLRPDKSEINAIAGDGDNMVLAIRGDYIPMIFLNRMFNIHDAIDDPTDGLVVITEAEDGNKVGIVVDAILGQQQVVIKSLENNYDKVEGIGAATILGNGEVSLILDLTALAEAASRLRGGVDEYHGVVPSAA